MCMKSTLIWNQKPDSETRNPNQPFLTRNQTSETLLTNKHSTNLTHERTHLLDPDFLDSLVCDYNELAIIVYNPKNMMEDSYKLNENSSEKNICSV